jgi:hypothetical protein
MFHSQGFQVGGRSEECDGCDDASHLHGSHPGVRPWQGSGMLRSSGRAVHSAAAKPCRPAGPRCRAGNVHVHASPHFCSLIARLKRRAACGAGGGCCGRAEWRGAGVPAAMPLGRPAHAGSCLSLFLDGCLCARPNHSTLNPPNLRCAAPLLRGSALDLAPEWESTACTAAQGSNFDTAGAARCRSLRRPPAACRARRLRSTWACAIR